MTAIRMAGPLKRAGFALVAALAVLAAAWRPAAAIEVEQITTPAGIEVWLVRNTTAPVIAIEFAFRQAGSTSDPPDRQGRANLVTYLLDEGAGELESQAFQERLDDLGIWFGFDVGVDAFYGSFKTTVLHADEAFELLRLALHEPRFDDDAVARMKAAVLGDIRQTVADPGWMVRRVFFETAFPGHPVSRPSRGTATTLETLTRQDLLDFVDSRFVRDRLVVAASGDIAGDDLARLVDRVFADLPSGGAVDAPAATEPAAMGSLVQIDRTGPQSTLLMALPGIDRGDPDYFTAMVLNNILGGSTLSSRLGDEVRGRRGLTYGISSYLFETDLADLWFVSSNLSNENVAEAIDATLAVFDDVAENGVTAAELTDAVTYLTGSYPLGFSSTDRVASRLLTWQLKDLGPDYLETRTAALESITQEDVAALAARLFATAPFQVVAGEPQPDFPADRTLNAADLAERELGDGS